MHYLTRDFQKFKEIFLRILNVAIFTKVVIAWPVQTKYIFKIKIQYKSLNSHPDTKVLMFLVVNRFKFIQLTSQGDIFHIRD